MDHLFASNKLIHFNTMWENVRYCGGYLLGIIISKYWNIIHAKTNVIILMSEVFSILNSTYFKQDYFLSVYKFFTAIFVKVIDKVDRHIYFKVIGVKAF